MIMVRKFFPMQRNNRHIEFFLVYQSASRFEETDRYLWGDAGVLFGETNRYL